MRYTHEGLTLWYGTEDTPAPEGIVDSADNPSVIAGVSPANPCNTVSVLYRVNRGFENTIRANLLRTEYGAGRQYFQAPFPKLPPGSKVEYTVIGENSGCRVPDPVVASELPHSFQIEDSKVARTSQAVHSIQAQPHGQEPPRFQVVSEFLARFSITIETPQIVGPTPDGIRVTWNAATGTVVGPRLSAKVLQGADWMQIRTDGVGNIDVRAILETGEGIRIMSVYSGVMEFGEDGYQNFLANRLSKPLKAWTTQRFLTTDSTYRWLNRLQCISVGEVFLDDMNYVYDVYALK